MGKPRHIPITKPRGYPMKQRIPEVATRMQQLNRPVTIFEIAAGTSLDPWAVQATVLIMKHRGSAERAGEFEGKQLWKLSCPVQL